MKNLLIKYIQPKEIGNHVDPNFTFLSYGDSDLIKTSIIKSKIESGSYVFFHTSYNGKSYITAYFYVEKILIKSNNSEEIKSLRTDSKDDEVVILGSRERSKILTFPLPFDKKVVKKLSSLGIDWSVVERGEQSDLKTISNSTRTHRELLKEEVEWLISQCSNRG